MTQDGLTKSKLTTRRGPNHGEILGRQKFIQYMTEGASICMELSMEITAAAMQINIGMVEDLLVVLNQKGRISFPCIRLSTIMQIEKWGIGPWIIDEHKDRRDFESFPDVIQQMSWQFVSHYAPHCCDDEYPDWPLLCYCAEAFYEIAKCFAFDLSAKSLPSVMGLLTEGSPNS